MVNIEYTTCITVFDELEVTIYYFYPNGIWDDDKLLLAEAQLKYPVNKYNWIFFLDDDDET